MKKLGYGNSVPFEVMQATSKLHIFVRENPEGFPLNRTIGNYTELYGRIILANMDSRDELISMTKEEISEFSKIFKNKQIPLSVFSNL